MKQELTPSESIALIERMIVSTRRRMERNTGRPSLIWGYTTVAVSLFNYLANHLGWPPAWAFSWFAIPVVGFSLMRLFPVRRTAEPRTEIDRIVSTVWSTATWSLVPIFGLSFLHGLSYRPSLLALIVLAMAVATVTTGRIVRSRLYILAGALGMAFSVLFAFYDWWLARLDEVTSIHLNAENLIFAAVFVVMMILPGHMLNYRQRRENRLRDA